MKKRNKRGGLTKLQKSDIISRQAPEGHFRVIGISEDEKSVWVVDTYTDFRSAKLVVDNQQSEGVQYYVHSDSNRILYRG